MENFKKDNYRIVKKDAFTVLEKVEQHMVDNDNNKNNNNKTLHGNRANEHRIKNT